MQIPKDATREMPVRKVIILVLLKRRQIISKAKIAKQASRFIKAKAFEGVIWPAFVKVKIVDIAPYSPPKIKALQIPHKQIIDKRIVIIALIFLLNKK